MPDRRAVSTESAPAAIGPYSQGMRVGDLLFCSGQIALDPSSGELVKEEIEGQARRCLQNLEAICEAAGASLSNAVRCTVYLGDMNDFARVNEAYAEFFSEGDPPARVAFAAAGLPKGADIEIDAIVAL
jgi:2-iminobutanoate/2-iminopropanoate deaminase